MTTPTSPASPTSPPSPVVWVDIETTGLDPRIDSILELACVVSSADFEQISGRFHELVRPRGRFEDMRMSPWAHRTHTASGLLAELEDKWDSLPYIEDIEDDLVEYVSTLLTAMDPGRVHHRLGLQSEAPEAPPMGGSSVHFDRSFMLPKLPKFMQLLHYRVVDVSAAKEFARRVWPGIELPVKREAHRAMPDVLESIEHAQWFRDICRGGQ